MLPRPSILSSPRRPSISSVVAVPSMVSFFGVPRQGSSGVQSMVAAKVVALAMRSIAAATAATSSNRCPTSHLFFLFRSCGFSDDRGIIHALLEVAHSANCTSLGELL